MYVKVKQFVRWFLLVAAVLSASYWVFTLTYRTARDAAEADGRRAVAAEVESLRASTRSSVERQTEIQRLTTLTLSAMEVVGAQLTEHRRLAMATTIARVAYASFSDQRHRDAWVALLAIESRFNKDARSPAGAVGVGQVTPPTARDFWKPCGLSEDAVDDLTEPLVNLPLSACIFKKTLEGIDGSIPLALAAYNAGRYSKTLSDLKKLRNVNSETSSYIAKNLILVEMLSKD